MLSVVDYPFLSIRKGVLNNHYSVAGNVGVSIDTFLVANRSRSTVTLVTIFVLTCDKALVAPFSPFAHILVSKDRSVGFAQKATKTPDY